MATRPGDSPPQGPIKKPEDALDPKRIPVSVVMFTGLMPLPGTDILQQMATSGVRRYLVGGQDYICPQIWYDPTSRHICISDRRYPIEQVKYWDRALQMAKEQDYREDLGRYTVTAPVRRIVK